MSRNSKRLLKYLVTLAMAAVTYMPQAYGDACATSVNSKDAKACLAQSAVADASGGNIQGPKGTINSGANTVTGAATNTASQYGAASQTCQSAAQDCKKACQTSKDQASVNKCKDLFYYAGRDQAGQVQAQSVANGSQKTADASSGGMGSMMGPLLGAAAGGLLGYMLGKQAQKNEDAQDQTATTSTGALQANCSIDCSQADAYQYADCDQYLLQNCVLNSLANLDTTNCQSFSDRYCNLSGAATSSNGTATSVACGTSTQPGTMQVTMGGVGEGIGTPYCKNVLAYNYCKTPGRSSCPSCMQLQANQSATCQTNPAECLAQNSPDQISQAQTSCPSDPMFSDPTYAAGGGSQVPSTLADNGLPIAVLPSGSTTTTTTTTPTTTTNIPTTLPASSGSTVVTAEGSGTRAGATGVASDTTASSASAASGGSGIATSYATESLNAAVDRVARSTSSTSSGSLGPAPDVQGQYGPSLFAMGTQVIQQRCNAGQLNCP